jgi:hypothetical protein
VGQFQKGRKMKQIDSLSLQLRMLGVALLLFSTINVHAAIVDKGLINLDTNTQLEWLDLTATAGLSVNDVLTGAGGWAADGWRHATFQEIESMWSHLGITEGVAPNVDVDAANLFFSTFGQLAQDLNIGLVKASQGWFDPIGLNDQFPALNLRTNEVVSAAVSLWSGSPNNADGAYADITNLIGTKFARYDDVGNFLVRTAVVPLPTPLALLVPAVMSLGFMRRKAK